MKIIAIAIVTTLASSLILSSQCLRAAETISGNDPTLGGGSDTPHEPREPRLPRDSDLRPKAPEPKPRFLDPQPQTPEKPHEGTTVGPIDVDGKRGVGTTTDF